MTILVINIVVAELFRFPRCVWYELDYILDQKIAILKSNCDQLWSNLFGIYSPIHIKREIPHLFRGMTSLHMMTEF